MIVYAVGDDALSPDFPLDLDEAHTVAVAEHHRIAIWDVVDALGSLRRRSR